MLKWTHKNHNRGKGQVKIYISEHTNTFQLDENAIEDVYENSSICVGLDLDNKRIYISTKAHGTMFKLKRQTQTKLYFSSRPLMFDIRDKILELDPSVKHSIEFDLVPEKYYTNDEVDIYYKLVQR